MQLEKEMFILATKRSNDEYVAEQMADTLEDVCQDLEYGDVLNGECQIWCYPNGDICLLQSDREVDEAHFYTTPYSTDGVVWLPKLITVSNNADKVKKAYNALSAN